MPRNRTRHPPSVALVVGAAALAACSSQAAGGGGEVDGEASCAAVVVVDGTRYLGYGALRHDPATTGRRVTGTLPGCDDSGGQRQAEPDESVEVAEVVGVPLATAVLWNGGLFVREGRELPPSTRGWLRAPRCRTAAEFALVADWIRVTSPKRPRSDGDLRLPYRLVVHVTEGPAAYIGATIVLRADATTDPSLGPEDVRDSLWEGGEVAARVACETGRFRAVALQVPRS